MSNDFPDDLKRAVREGRLVPFAGAGVSMAVCRQDGSRAFPDWREALDATADELHRQGRSEEALQVRKHLDAEPSRFLEAAQLAQEKLQPHLWSQLLRRQFDLAYESVDLSTLAVAKAVWELAPNLVVTSNFDRVLRWTCPRHHDLREWSIEDRQGHWELQASPQLERPAVWYLHGTIQRPHELVLGADAYGKLYASSSAPDARETSWDSARHALHHLLTTRTLLFIGFSFADQRFTAQVTRIASLYAGYGTTHYALVREAELEQFQSRLGKLLWPVPYQDHGQPLVDQLRRLAAYKGGGASPASPAPGMRSDSQSLATWSGPELDAMLLLGAWSPGVVGDRQAVARLGADPTKLERLCAELAVGESSPLRYDIERGANHQWIWNDPDRSWPALISRVPSSVLKIFAELALEVLGERHPALDLPKDERLFAAIQGKALKYSDAIRRGIASSLVRLAASDDSLKAAHGPRFGSTLAKGVVFRVLLPEWPAWASLDDLLPLLAEASPTTFVERLEKSLGMGDAGAAHVFTEESTHGGSVHSGLLWALETIGWLPEMMSQVANLLARLAARDPGGTLANRPDRSLCNLLHPFLPQSTSTGAQRIAILRSVMKRESEIGWRVGIALLEATIGPGMVFPSRKPEIARWPLPEEDRDVPKDAAEQVTSLLELLIEATHDQPERWSLLLARLWQMPQEFATRVLDGLTNAHPSDYEAVWSALRALLHDVYRYGESWRVAGDVVQRVESLYRQLTPEDIVPRTRWLFDQKSKIPERIFGDWKEEAKRLEQRQAEALNEIWQRADRWELLSRLAATSASEWRLGYSLGGAPFADEIERHLVNAKEAPLDKLLPSFLARRYLARGADWLRPVIDALIRAGRLTEAVATLTALPAGGALWDLLDAYGGELKQEYWRAIDGLYADRPPGEWERAIRELVAIKRPSLALEVASQAAKHLSPVMALDVLEAVAAAPEDEAMHIVQRGSSGYHIGCVLGIAGDAEGVPLDRLVELEWALLPLLRDNPGAAKHLFSALGTHPAFFADLVLARYPPATGDSDTRARALGAHRVLDMWKGYPSAGNLLAWCQEVLRLTEARDMKEHGAYEIGQVLARVPPETDEVWPVPAARELLKRDHTKAIARGIWIAKRNSRGVTSRSMGEGGQQERELVAAFRQSAARLQVDWPETAALLNELAESYEEQADREDAIAESDRRRYGLSAP